MKNNMGKKGCAVSALTLRKPSRVKEKSAARAVTEETEPILPKGHLAPCSLILSVELRVLLLFSFPLFSPVSHPGKSLFTVYGSNHLGFTLGIYNQT